jgi:hypothetical protein
MTGEGIEHTCIDLQSNGRHRARGRGRQYAARECSFGKLDTGKTGNLGGLGIANAGDYGHRSVQTNAEIRQLTHLLAF